MSSSDSCIVYSVRGCLARNCELERLLNQLVDRLAADHWGAEVHPGEDGLHRLREELVGGLQRLERIHVGLAVIAHHELRLDFAGDARALENRRVFRLRAVGKHFRRLLNLKFEVRLRGRDPPGPAYYAAASPALPAFPSEVVFVGDGL